MARIIQWLIKNTEKTIQAYEADYKFKIIRAIKDR